MNRTLLLGLLLSGAGVNADPPPEPKAAAALNQQGLDAHRHGDFAKASELFAQAAQLDPERGIYPYNQACAMARLRRQGHTCEAMFSQVMELLVRAAELDPSRKKRAIVDPDLTEFRRTVTFARWSGIDDRTEVGLRALLPRVSWNSTQVYAERSIGGPMTFRPDGALETSPGDRCTWSVRGQRVTVDCDYAQPKRHQRIEYEYRPDEQALIPSTPGELRLDDFPDECNL